MTSDPSDAPDLAADAVHLATELVAIDSVNPGLVPGAAGEAEVVEHLRERLAASGFATSVHAPSGRPDRPSLVAVGPSGAPGPTVVLTGHVDTVGVSGMDDPFTPHTDGDRMTGRGAVDMKGGIAGLVVAAEELARRGAPGRVVLALVADEEDASLGTETVLAALPGLGVHPDVAVLAEPTGLARTTSLRGYALVEVDLAGRAAHSSQPAEGVNAVTHLGRLLAAVEDRDRELAPTGGSLMVTVARGGESPFVLAQHAHAVVERRTVAGEDSTGVLEEVEALLAGMRGADPTVEARARLVISREAWRLDDSGPAAELAEALQVALGDAAPAEPHDAPAWMEAPLWQAAGVPTLVCGPGGGGLHSADEWLDLRQLRAFPGAVVAAVEAWAGARAH